MNIRRAALSALAVAALGAPVAPAVAAGPGDVVRVAPRPAPSAARHAALPATGPGGIGWHLDRIDQRGTARNNRYSPTRSGAGVTAYVVGFQIDRDHPALGSRVRPGWDTTGGDGRVPRDSGCGFGSNEADLLGGTDYGVAHRVTIRPVAIFPCDFETPVSDVVRGIDWMIADHAAGAPAVALFAWAVDASAEVDAAVRRLIGDGVTVVAAAPSDPDAGACDTSPARVPGVITVGGTAPDDRVSTATSQGSCLDVLAPLENVFASGASGGGVALNSNASSAPLVAGVVAQYLEDDPSATPARATAAVLDSATRGALKGRAAGTPDRLLFAHPASAPAAASGSTIRTGQALLRGRTITSPNGYYRLTARADGDVTLGTGAGRTLWRVGSRTSTWLAVDGPGRVRAFDRGRAVWTSPAAGGISTLRVQDDGNLVVYRDVDQRVGWVSRTAGRTPPPQPPSGSDRVPPGQALYRDGVLLESPNGRYRAFVRASTGRLAVRDLRAGRDVWASPAAASRGSDWLVNQPDGNVVLYDRAGRALWSTGTGGRGAARLLLRDDGTLRVFRGGTQLWASR